SFAEHALGVLQEVAEQLVLGRRQRDLVTSLQHLVRVVVELDVAVAQNRRRLPAATRRPAEDGTDSGDDFFETERFGDVVVATQGETRDLVLCGVASREK